MASTSIQGTAPWYVINILLPFILLGINLYLVGGMSRAEKALEVQSAMLTQLAVLVRRVDDLEKIEGQQRQILDRVVTEQQNRAPRLALLELGLDRLSKGQERIEQQIAALRESVNTMHGRQPGNKGQTNEMK